jgi:hypothetical protein
VGLRGLSLRSLGPPERHLGLGARPRRERAVYAPALVAFVGSGRPQQSSPSGGGTVAASVGWFPLAPREVYRPSYAVSQRYFDAVNRSNARSRRPPSPTSTTATNVTNVTNVVNVVYANQQGARRGGRGADPDVRAGAAGGTAAVAMPRERSPPRRRCMWRRSRRCSRACRARRRRRRQAAGARAEVVVARTAPPPPPVPFAAQQQQLAAKPGARSTRRSARSSSRHPLRPRPPR